MPKQEETVNEDGFMFRKKSKKLKRSKKRTEVSEQTSNISLQSNHLSKRQRVYNNNSSSSSASSPSSFSSTTNIESSIAQDSLMPKYPTVKPQPSIRNVNREDPATGLTELIQNLVDYELKAVTKQFGVVGNYKFISEWASTCCSEFLTAVEERIDQKRQEHLVVEPEQLVNPVNVRLKKQRDQLEVLLQRLNTEVQAWQSHSNDKWDQPNVSNEISEEEVKEAEAYKQDIKNDTERPFDQMNSKIMKMAVQVEQIQHVLEQSKRTVITAETKRMQLSAQVHTAGKYSKKKTSSLIRGFLG